MVTKAPQQLPAVDQVVIVPWGLGEAIGVVEDAYSTGSGPRVRVRIAVEGPEGEELDTFSFVLPAGAVRPAVE